MEALRGRFRCHEGAVAGWGWRAGAALAVRWLLEGGQLLAETAMEMLLVCHVTTRTAVAPAHSSQQLLTAQPPTWKLAARPAKLEGDVTSPAKTWRPSRFPLQRFGLWVPTADDWVGELASRFPEDSGADSLPGPFQLNTANRPFPLPSIPTPAPTPASKPAGPAGLTHLLVCPSQASHPASSCPPLRYSPACCLLLPLPRRLRAIHH